MQRSSIDEASLIQAAKRGDLEAFNRLVLAYQDMAYQQAFRMLGDPADADDATQEAFIRSYQKLHQYRGGSFRAWMLRILVNICYDEFRRQRRRPSTPLEPTTAENEAIESPGWLHDPKKGPEELLERSELARVIQRCIERLPLEFRTVVILVDVQGLEYAEAANVIAKPIGTVRSRLARARVRLQECLHTAGELLPVRYRQGKEIKK
ncbi:MAG: sigma-70 family RNA polymerase sigma factor [Chloroflexota bacterium]